VAWIRCAGALVVVWVVSFALYPLHLTALAAAIWIVATILLVPIGITLVDRIVALLLLAAAPAVLIAWFSPSVPWLVSPPVLAGLLGSLVALAWGLRWTRPVAIRMQDGVSICMGVLTALLFWLPFSGGGLARAVGLLSPGYDQASHYFMWMRVWANHGYLVLNSLPDPDYWDWRVYPQGAQAMLANLGAVITAGAVPPAQPATSANLFVVFYCVVVGALALVTAWSVDRISRSRKLVDRRLVAGLQVAAVLLVAIGPGSSVVVQSLSYTVGLVVVIPAMALAATAQRSPRRDGILIGAALIAAAATYPICALMAVLVWPLYLWTSRHFWLASTRRRVYAVVWTVVVAGLCVPTFVMLALSNVQRNWETWGYFQGIHPIAYLVIAVLLAALIGMGRGRLPKAAQYVCWVGGAVSGVLAAEGILQWLTKGEFSYYTIKTMYFGWMLAVIAVAAGLAAYRKPRKPAGSPAGTVVIGPSAVAAVVLLIAWILLAIPLQQADQKDPNRGALQSLSKEAWVRSNAAAWQDVGELEAQAAKYAASHSGVTVAVPCLVGRDQLVTTWSIFLTGGMSPTDWEVVEAICPASAEAPLKTLPRYLQLHPEVTVNALALDQSTYDYAVQAKKELGLTNLTVVPQSN